MITAIVPARGGSKRLPGKNIKPLAGRPLIFHTLDAILGHSQITKRVFSSDSDEYIKLVIDEYEDDVLIEKRPDHYAADSTKVFEEVVRLAESNIIDSEWFMLCLPTAPLRNHTTVKRLLEEWKKDNCARFSASSYDFPIQFAFDISTFGDWEPVFNNSPMVTGNTRSQDIPIKYRPNGAIYLQKTETLFRNNNFYNEAKPFLISDIESTDVDTAIEFKLAELLIGETK